MFIVFPFRTNKVVLFFSFHWKRNIFSSEISRSTTKQKCEKNVFSGDLFLFLIFVRLLFIIFGESWLSVCCVTIRNMKSPYVKNRRKKNQQMVSQRMRWVFIKTETANVFRKNDTQTTFRSLFMTSILCFFYIQHTRHLHTLLSTSSWIFSKVGRFFGNGRIFSYSLQNAMPAN